MDFLLNFSPLTLTLLALVAGMTVYFVGPGYSPQSAAHSPTILTSTGIFGTFLGVALGLLEFDTSDIQASVPALIGGLRTAFWTSIAGLFGSLLVKFRHLITSLRQARVGTQYEAATIDDLANLLGDIRTSLNDAESDGLRCELTRLKAEQHQDFARLGDTLEHYQTDMAEANTQALVAALETVMRDFNTQINTQYGENFRELNEAVGNMLLWQQNYKTELQELLETQKSNGELLDRASHAYEKVVTHSEVFNSVSESMGTMMEALQSQSEGLDRYLSQLATVAEKATEGLPSLEGRVDALTHQLAESVQRNQEQLSQVLNDASAALRDTSAEVNRNLADSLEQSQQTLRQQVESMVTRSHDQIEALDKAMEEELTKALTTFGYQMTSLSEKFVNDYAPLTDKLRELVQLAAVEGEAEASQGVSHERNRNSRERNHKSHEQNRKTTKPARA